MLEINELQVMEEIYKPDKEDAGKIEIYNRENNDMLGEMPEWLIHTGSYIVYGLIIVLIIGTALFKYPDTIKKAITIDDMGNVEWITANQAGMIDRFFVENQSQVKRNDTLGILKNTASLKDVQIFCRVLTNIEWYYRSNDIKYLEDYPFNLILGEMAPAYEQFTQAVRTCMMYEEFDLYPQKKKYLDEELRILESTGQADALSVLRMKRELFELEINHKMEIEKNRRMLELAYENMVNNLKIWEKKYLIKSSHDGMLIWGKSWGMSSKVNEGDTLCTVISKQQGNPSGHIKLSQDEVAEIAVGNQVNIELNKYPTHSYGVLPGKVESISFVPYNKSYAIEVGFPDGLVTTNNKEIKYEIDMSGRAEIITSSRSILSRIFAPIYELFKQK